MSAVFDASHCPLCGAANLCAAEVALQMGETGGMNAAQGECWCMQADFSLAPLDQVPAASRGLACLCARCAAGQVRREKNPLS